MNHRITFICICCALAPMLIYAAADPAADTENIMVKRTISAAFTDHPPVIDGDLSDSAWNLTEPQSEFRRRIEPDRGAISRVQTIVRVLVDSRNMYFGLEMHGVDPGKILHSVTKRDDDLDRDDFICVILDTFHDLRSAYFFQVNLLGTQRDLYSTGNGRQVDMGWDAVWDAAARTLPDGWSVEMRIPFKILRFNWSPNMTFGMNILRGCSQREDISEWCTLSTTSNDTLDPRYYGNLTGLDNIDKPHLFQLISSLTASSDRTNNDAWPDSDETGWTKKDDLDGGLDMIWGITPELTLNATLNPDFAQIEADADEINLTGDELYLEERRPFFRENNAIFQVPDGVMPFYTRRIVDIDTGIKLTGQVADSDIAALLIDGRDGSGEDDYFAVLRSQSPISEKLTVSGYFIAKTNQDSLSDYENSHGETYDTIDNDRNIVGGVDLALQTGDWRFDFHGYRSWYPDSMRPWYTDTPTADKNLFHFKAKYRLSNIASALDLSDIGAGYYPELGFVSANEMGTRKIENWVWAQHVFPEDHFLNAVDMFWEWRIGWDRDDGGSPVLAGGELSMSTETDSHFTVNVSGEWTRDKTYERFGRFTRDESGDIIDPTADYFYSTLGHGDNRIQLFSSRMFWSDGGWNRFGGGLTTGLHYYSRIMKTNLFYNWTFRGKLSIEADIDYLKRYAPTANHLEFLADHDSTGDEDALWTDTTTWIFRDKMTWHFAEESYVRLILSGYLDSERVADHYDISALIAWRYRPGSYLYLVYENVSSPYDPAEDRLTGLDDLTVRQETFYCKLTFMLDL